MGAGKPPGAGAGSNGEERRKEVSSDQGLSIAELFSELVHAEVPLSTAAGLTDVQLMWVLGRKRKDNGELVRPAKAQGERKFHVSRVVGFEEMYRQTKREQSKKFKGQIVRGKLFKGHSEEDIDRLWESYLRKNPQLRLKIERDRRRRRNPR